MTSPDYSAVAAEYAASRPRYPSELFDWIASIVARRQTVWDCATGSGQAAIDLADRFDRVIATDMNREQLRRARYHPRIEYRVATAESSGLDAASMDAVTVAAAAHWFDLPRFHQEARRVVRSGGALIVWTYHVGHMEGPFDRIISRFYADVLAPYFPPGARLVDARYETLPMIGEPLTAPSLAVSAVWTLPQFFHFMESWSGRQTYLERHGTDPVDQIRTELERAWGDPQTLRTLRWPLYIRAGRL